MSVCQNGWSTNPPNRCSQPVPGTRVWLTLRNDEAGWLLLEVASAFDRLVEDIDNALGHLDDWGWADRPIRGGTQTSNHAGAVAEDLNAVLHALGVTAARTFTPAQIEACHRIVDACLGVVRWGGDYDNPRRGGVRGSRPDPMHWELADGTTLADCRRALPSIRRFNNPNWIEVSDMAVPVLKENDGRKGGGERGRLHWYVVRLQACLNVSGLGQVNANGEFGADTTALVKAVQHRAGLPETGVVDAATWGAVLGNDAPDWA